jgi:hypothetical protein
VLHNKVPQNLYSSACMLTNYMQRNPFWEANIFSEKARNSPNFMQGRSWGGGGGEWCDRLRRKNARGGKMGGEAKH